MTTFTFPDIAPEQLRWHLMANTQRFLSPLTGAMQRLELPGAAWVIEARFGQLKRAEADELEAFIGQLRGGVHLFTWYHRGRATPRGVGTGTPLVDGASQTGTSLLTDGWTADTAGVLLPGDFFSVNSELKRVVSTVNSATGGAATVTFEPPLRAAPADNAAITVTNPTATFAINSADEGNPTQRGPLSALSLRAREAW